MRVLQAFATLVAGAALACVVAYWGWRMFGPPAVHLAAPGSANPAATLAAANLFGGATSPASPTSAGAAALGNDARLLGIIAEPGERGFALFRFPSGPRLIAQGQEISAGVTLVSVQPDAVTIRDGAGERRYPLRSDTQAASRAPAAGSRGAPGAASTAGSRPVAAGGRASATCGPPAGFRGTVVRLNTELMGGVGADSVQWHALLAPVTGGLVVKEDKGFGAMLGLRAGDRLAQANGIALSVPEDVASAIVRPLVANQGVRVIGARNGTTQELWLANAACAG